MTAAEAAALTEIDFTDLDNFADGFPHDLFALHRRVAPVFWHEPTQHTPDGEGFWSVASYAETLAVLREPGTYSSVSGGDRPYGGTLLQDLAIAGQVLNMMDDPRHAQIRRLVSSGLTPRMIRQVEDDLRGRARRLLDAVVPGEPFDFLVDVAAELPMQMICILLGVPESERHWLFEAIEPQFDFGGSRTAHLSQLSVEEAGSRMYAYGQELIAAKRAEPTDDLLSVVVNARADDGTPALSDLELYLFFSLLFSAGAETTRNAVAGGLLALAEHPAQFRRLRTTPQSLAVAVEEMVRWTSPSPSKRRTATRDVTLGGQSIEAGQKVQIGRARPTATARYSIAPTNSTSPASPIRTWASVRACTTAWVQIWRGWNFACCSRNCSRASVTSNSWRRSNGPAAIATPGSGTWS
jgi:cytochrome P450